jgi:hypothetical protein
MRISHLPELLLAVRLSPVAASNAHAIVCLLRAYRHLSLQLAEGRHHLLAEQAQRLHHTLMRAAPSGEVEQEKPRHGAAVPIWLVGNPMPRTREKPRLPTGIDSPFRHTSPPRRDPRG